MIGLAHSLAYSIHLRPNGMQTQCTRRVMTNTSGIILIRPRGETGETVEAFQDDQRGAQPLDWQFVGLGHYSHHHTVYFSFMADHYWLSLTVLIRKTRGGNPPPLVNRVCKMTKKTVFAYIRTHTGKSAHKKAYFVGYQRRGEAYQALRYDSWLAAVRRWWQLRRHPAYKRVRLYRA